MVTENPSSTPWVCSNRWAFTCRPHSSDLKGSRYLLRELRVKAQGAQIRIAYAFDPARNGVLVIGGEKAGDDRFYRRFIPKAEEVWEQYLKEQGVKP